MLLKVLFWLFVALDVAGLGLMFVLGLAAAGPSKTSPLAVVFAMLVVPGVLLGGAILLHLRAQSGLLQLLAFVLVSAPAAFLAISRIVAEFAVPANPGSIWGETKLTRALRELEKDPLQLATVRTLLAEGADPNEAGEQMPLVLAIYAARHVGQEPTKLLLDRGADPNRQDQFGRPCWFAATGGSADLGLLTMLLETGRRREGAEPGTARAGSGVRWPATTGRRRSCWCSVAARPTASRRWGCRWWKCSRATCARKARAAPAPPRCSPRSGSASDGTATNGAWPPRAQSLGSAPLPSPARPARAPGRSPA